MLWIYVPNHLIEMTKLESHYIRSLYTFSGIDRKKIFTEAKFILLHVTVYHASIIRLIYCSQHKKTHSGDILSGQILFIDLM